MTKIPKDRKSVRDVGLQPNGMYAVFRHSVNLKRAHFCALHDSYESASAEAIRLLTEAIASPTGQLQHMYYVIEIKASFQGGPEGLKSSEG